MDVDELELCWTKIRTRHFIQKTSVLSGDKSMVKLRLVMLAAEAEALNVPLTHTAYRC